MTLAAFALALPLAQAADTAKTTTTTTTTETKAKDATLSPGDKTTGQVGTVPTNPTGDTEKMGMLIEGPVVKVVPAKKEIYVQASATNKKHEFYFKPDTTLTQGGQPADFSVLKEGTRVRVTYKTVGKREEPVKVEIVQ